MNIQPRADDRAVVIGASIAGLLAARVLSEHFNDVVLLERDELPRTAAPRKGTPHAVHPHGLLARGREIMEALFPGFTDGVVLLESGTPRTFQRFTLHSLGRVGGIPQTVSSAGFGAIHHTTPIPGLLLAGETVFPGQGTLGVSVSGFNAYRTAKRFLHGKPRFHALSTAQSA